MKEEKVILVNVWDEPNQFYAIARLSGGYDFEKKVARDLPLVECLSAFLNIHKLQNPTDAFDIEVNSYDCFSWSIDLLSRTARLSDVPYPLIVLAVRADDPKAQATYLRGLLQVLPEPKKTLEEWIRELGSERCTGVDIFLCHGAEDAVIAREVLGFLEGQGYRCWQYERDAIACADHLGQTKRQIETCGAFVSILSASTLGSSWITTEILIAAGSHKPRFPVLLGINYEDLPIPLQQAFGTAVAVPWCSDAGESFATLERILQGVRYALGR